MYLKCFTPQIFISSQVPIDWDVVDVKPVKLEDGRMGIPPSTIDIIKKHKIGLKGNIKFLLP